MHGELVVKLSRRGEVGSGKATAIGVVLEVGWVGKLLVEVSNLSVSRVLKMWLF